MAIVQAEANGYEMPPFDPANYPIIRWVRQFPAVLESH